MNEYTQHVTQFIHLQILPVFQLSFMCLSLCICIFISITFFTCVELLGCPHSWIQNIPTERTPCASFYSHRVLFSLLTSERQPTYCLSSSHKGCFINRITQCIDYFSHCCSKIPDKSKPEIGGLTLASRSDCSWQRKVNAGLSSFPPLLQGGAPVYKAGLSAFRIGLHTSINTETHSQPGSGGARFKS